MYNAEIKNLAQDLNILKYSISSVASYMMNGMAFERISKSVNDLVRKIQSINETKNLVEILEKEGNKVIHEHPFSVYGKPIPFGNMEAIPFVFEKNGSIKKEVLLRFCYRPTTYSVKDIFKIGGRPSVFDEPQLECELRDGIKRISGTYLEVSENSFVLYLRSLPNRRKLYNDVSKFEKGIRKVQNYLNSLTTQKKSA